MERCTGESLESLVRALRWSWRTTDRHRLLDALHATGAWLGEFHDAHPEQLPPGPLLEQLHERALGELAGGARPNSRLRRRLEHRLRALHLAASPAGLRVVATHGDFWPGNVFVEGESVSVIDFEGARPGLAHEDVAYFLTQLEPYLSFPTGRHLGGEARAAFRGGYFAGQRPEPHGFAFCGLAATISALARCEQRQHRRRRALLSLLESWL